jgi:hypothetical protein
VEETMISDGGSSQEPTPQPELWTLPDILELSIRRIPYTAPERRYGKSLFAGYNEAIEFTVYTDQPFPDRAVTPILYVGDEPVTEGFSTDDKTVYRYLAFEFDRLEKGAPISIGWPGHNTPRQKTRFQYSLDENNSKSE